MGGKKLFIYIYRYLKIVHFGSFTYNILNNNLQILYIIKITIYILYIMLCKYYF